MASRLRLLLARAEGEIPDSALPERTPPREPRRLTVGMATYDDYDGVYFTVQALVLYHREVLADTEIVVVDNHPEGPAAPALKRLEDSVPNLRYVPFRSYRGTAVRDVVFREAAGESVLCIDGHVLLAPGALARLLEHLDAHPDSADLLQGPLVRDAGGPVSTHFDPVWRRGMYGAWGHDPRGADPDREPFEIPMQGLGLFACRREAWPGFNPRFRGFGGEEGYLHEKIRRAGHRTLCLPFLRWAHRFERPGGPPYRNTYADRIRNYLIGWRELGLDDGPVVAHFTEQLGASEAGSLVAEVRAELDNPFSFFDAIYCINRRDQPERWWWAERRLARLGLSRLVRRFDAVTTPDLHHAGVALSHRGVIEEARRLGLRHVLVLEDDVIFHEHALEHLRPALVELADRPWDLCYLGGRRVGHRVFERAPGAGCLDLPQDLVSTHAVAYHRASFDRLLALLPATRGEMAHWIAEHRAIDQWLRGLQQAWRCFVIRPAIATQRELIPDEPEAERARFVIE